MPKIVDHAQRRAEIAQALWQVIFEQGIDGVSFRAVAEAGGVSIGRVQHYFAGKDELVLYGCRFMVEAAEVEYGPDAGPLDPERAREELIALVSAPIPVSESFRMGASVWVAYQAKAVSHPGIGVVVAEAMAGRQAAMAALLHAARGDADRPEVGIGGTGCEPGDGARTDAVLLASLSEGLTQRVLAGALTSEESLRLIRDEVCRRLRPAPRRGDV